MYRGPLWVRLVQSVAATQAGHLRYSPLCHGRTVSSSMQECQSPICRQRIYLQISTKVVWFPVKEWRRKGFVDSKCWRAVELHASPARSNSTSQPSDAVCVVVCGDVCCVPRGYQTLEETEADLMVQTACKRAPGSSSESSIWRISGRE